MALTNPQETTEERPTCCAYAAGRVFYGMKNSVYFSQVMEGESIDFLNRCYQQNDPTAEQLSDLLATDGGVLQVNEAVGINQLTPLGNGLVIYAQNGVWWLSGPDTGFTATNFFLEQISEAGCISAHSVVRVEDTHFFWSKEGIFLISINEFGRAVMQDILSGTLQTFYNEISIPSKEKSCGVHDRIKKQVEWFYASTDQDTGTDYKFAHDKSLILDLRSGGFWPQEYNAQLTEGDGDFVYCGVPTNKGTEAGEVALLTFEPDADVTDVDVLARFSFKTDGSFQDFSSNYPKAYLETGYDALEKPSNTKTAPYVFTHFLQTEENWVSDGAGGLQLDKQSGCQLRSKWDWNDTSANGRWGPAQQAYRFRRPFTPPDVAGTFDSGELVTSTKNKVLGRGKALSLRFEQEDGKDMQLLGWTVQWTIKASL